MSTIQETATSAAVAVVVTSNWYNYSIKFAKGFSATLGINTEATGGKSEDEVMSLIEDTMKQDGFSIYDRAVSKEKLGGQTYATTNDEWYNYNVQLANKVVVTMGIHSDMVVDGLESEKVKALLKAELEAGNYSLTKRANEGRASF